METNWTPSEAMLKVDIEIGLKHAAHCRNTSACGAKSCTRLKRLLAHPGGCSVKSAGGCTLCLWYWQLLTEHAKQCRDNRCPVEHCNRLKPVRKPSTAVILFSWMRLGHKRRQTAASSMELEEEVSRQQERAIQENDDEAWDDDFEDDGKDFDVDSYIKHHEEVFKAENPMYKAA